MAKSRLNSKDVSQILNQKKKNRKFRSFIIVLAAFVMALTSFSLSETGITMTADALNENVGKTSLLGNVLKKITPPDADRTFTVSGSDAWADLKEKLEANGASGTYNITIDGTIAASSPITINENVTLNLSGTNNATIYVDGGKAWDGDTSMFKVAGGTLNVENVTLSGKTATFGSSGQTKCENEGVANDATNSAKSKVSYRKSADCSLSFSNSSVTLSGTNLQMGGTDLKQSGNTINVGGTGKHLMLVLPSSINKDVDPVTVALSSFDNSTEYFIYADYKGGVFLKLHEDKYIEFTTNSDPNTSGDADSFKWIIDANGGLVNVGYPNYVLYKANADSTSLTLVNKEDGGCSATDKSALYIGTADGTVKQEVFGNDSGLATSGKNIKIYNSKPEGGKIVRDAEAENLVEGSYYFIGKGDTTDNLHANDNGAVWNGDATAGTDMSKIRKLWQYSNGLFVNEVTKQMIYFDGTNISVIKQNTPKNSPTGCTPASEYSEGSWKKSDANYNGIKDGTKGFFINATGGTVNLNDGTIIEEMNYTGTSENVSPIYVNGATLNIDGATIRKNYGGKMPKNRPEAGGNDLTYGDVIKQAKNRDETNDSLKSWDINPIGRNYRANQDSATNHAAGAILIESGTVNLNSGTIQDNTGIAGAVYVKGGTFNQTNGRIETNHSYKGAVVVDGEGSSYVMSNGYLYNNDSVYRGGAISALDEGNVTIGTATGACDANTATPQITKNKTLEQGGGIYVQSNNVHINRAEINNNIAHVMGGGIYVQGGDGEKHEKNSVLVLKNAYVTDNEAGNQAFTNEDGVIGFNATYGWHNETNWGQGGGMWLCTYGSVLMNSNYIHLWNNTSHRDGNDFFKVSKGSYGVVVEFEKDDHDKYVYHDTGETFTFTSPITSSLSLDNGTQSNKANFDNEMTTVKNNDCNYVQISGNKAGYAGGGLGVNGVLSYEPLKNEHMYIPSFSFTKRWYDENNNEITNSSESAKFIVNVYEKTGDGERLVKSYGDTEDPNGQIVIGDREPLTPEEEAAISDGVVDYGFTINGQVVTIALPQLFDESGNSKYAAITSSSNVDGSDNGYTINDLIRIEIIEEAYGTSYKYDLQLGDHEDFVITTSENEIKNWQEQVLMTYHTISLKSPDVKNIKKEIPGTKIKVNKVWNVETGVEIPDSIQVQLYRNGEAYGEPVTINTGKELNSNNGYNTYTWEGLPKYDEDWNLYTYTVKEIPVDGFTSYISFTEGNTEYECDVNVGDITGWKEIDISELSAGRKFRMRVGDNVYYVQYDGKNQTLTTKKKTSNEANTANVLFEYESQSSYSKNNYTYYFLKGLKSSVVKTNYPYLRLDRDNKNLHMSSKKASIKEFGYIGNGIKKMYINAPSNGVYSWLDGDLVPSESDSVTNSIPQVILEVPEYAKDTSGCKAVESPGIFTITNSDQVVELEFEKVWSDNQNKTHRPSSITVDLFRNSETVPYRTVKVTGSETDNKWYYKFTNLPKYDKHRNPITYRISERAIDYYQGSGDISIISTNINGANGDTVESWKELTYKELKDEQFRIVVSDKVYYIEVDPSGNKVLKTGSASDKDLYNTKSLWKVNSDYNWNNGYSVKYMTFESVAFPDTYITTEGGHSQNGANTGKLILGNTPTTFTYDIYSKYLYWGTYYSSNSGYFTGDIDNNCTASFVKTEKANMVEKTTVTITNTYKEHEGLEIQKKNENNQNLEKAITFTIWSFDGRASLDITTDNKGHYVADNIETLFKPVFAGRIGGKTYDYTGTKYVLVEKDPPEGYTILPSGVPFEIDANGRMKFLNSTDSLGNNYNSSTSTLNSAGSRPAIKIDWSLIGDKNSGKDIERDKDDNRLVLNVVNRPIDNELILTKVNSSNSNQKLKDAKFSISQITSETDKTLIKKIENTARDDKLWVTDENGEWKVEDLPPGVYLITEFEAPENYHLSNEEIIVVVDDKTGKITVKLQDNSLGTLNTTNGTTQVNFIFANNPVTYTLPETGGLGTSTCIGMGSIMIIIGALLLGKKYLSEVRG